MDINKEYDEVKKLLEDQKNESQVISMARYMKNKFLFYGIPASKRKEVYKGILKREKTRNELTGSCLISVIKMNIEKCSILYVII